MVNTRPSTANASIDLDKNQIKKDVHLIKGFNDLVVGLKQLVLIRQEEIALTGLNVSTTVGLFEGSPKFPEF